MENDIKPIFEMDTRSIKAIKIFLDTDTLYSGRLVLKSIQNQYKVFHFQHGGLDRLCKVFDVWHSCVTLLSSSPELNTRHYDICTPNGEAINLQIPRRDKVDSQVWRNLFDGQGRLVKKTQFKEAVFFAGIVEEMRKEVWKFLLEYYPYDSTFEQRQELKLQRTKIYKSINDKRQGISGEEQKTFYRKVECIVDKDVVRTDRSSQYYAGADNPHVQTLRRILLNYAIDNPVVGYTQGMSDLLAPLLVIMDNEIDAYWCFIGLMEKSVFLNTPQNDMEEQLGLLRELLRTMLPHFYAHCMKFLNGMELLFCHRWLLLCFRREVGEYQAQRIWEAAWSQHHTSYFHLFLCAAAISVYGDTVIEKDLSPDLTLLHFTSIQEMDGNLLLRRAHELLYDFLVQDIIPCTLMKILSDSGEWDSPPTPTIYC
ncbi:uncharacterized protein TRIADDRAFT_20890, partial [Trichoplax adhaerens]